MIKERIQKISTDIFDTVVANRRYLHANPELSFKEYKTAAFIQSKLNEIGIQWKTMSGTGVVATIKGNLDSEKVIALRADIDALPIREMNEVSYKSTCEGVMHACGHDAHTASMLGTAFILDSLKDEFGGTVKIIFQPAEEILPGGASLMIKDGVLENPAPSCIIGQHVSPFIEAGTIAVRPGKFMASMDELFVTVKGKGGHGAQPHQNIDPVVITAQIITSLQQVVSRISNPFSPTVLSFGKVIANGAINIIPDEVYMEGTFRAMDEQWRDQAHERMIKIATGIAESMGGSCEFKISKGYPVLVNNPRLAENIKVFAEDYLGNQNVLEAEKWMAAEDFAYYTQKTDACFFVLGVGNKQKNISAPLHSPNFSIDEQAFNVSTGLMAYIALQQLKNQV
ncbi:MAG: amidohydrolase [Bacteroidetes bacterium]|nr:amidohydrolase [Bacteroidota bacterium]